jgi:hypothetical protein
LRQGNDRHVELLGEGLQAGRNLGHLAHAVRRGTMDCACMS